MPLPPVVIELSPRDVASEHAPALVAACTEAVRDGRCEVLDAGPKPDARAVAIVSSNEAYTQVRVELGLRREGRTRWAVRTLDFGPADPERERAKTVGFVIGTLVGEAEREPTTKAATPKQPAQIEYVAKTQPPQEPSAERAGLQLFLELGAIVDSALDSGAPRWGGAARLGAVIHGPWEAYLGAGYGMRPRDEQGLRTRWYSLEFGAGVAHPLTSTLTLTAAVAPAAERLQADVGEPRPDEGGRWVFGLGARLGARSNVTDRISIVFALQSMLRESGTVITLDGRDAGRQPSLSLGGSLGVRLMPF
ncbi:MAG TPA: hypothetical protein PKA88_09905 [Polyangiaceae bacterium]|nr:hypothetical protein [Polyangiaceae bacterium]